MEKKECCVGDVSPKSAPWAMLYLALCAASERAAEATLVEQMSLSDVLCCAKQHDMVACVYEALKPFVSRTELWQGSLPAWQHAVKLSLRRTMLFGSEYAAVCEFLEKEKISYMPLKGICLAPLYPASHMRDMGDVDIWYDKTRRDDVLSFFEKRGYSTAEMGNHDAFKKPPVYNFEMHTALFSSVTNEVFANYYSHFDEKMQKSVGESRQSLRAEDMFIYLVLHEYRHFLGGGVGVRYLLDRYRYVLAFQMMDSAYIERELSLVGARAYHVKTETLVSWLFADPERLFSKEKTAEELLLLSHAEAFLSFGVHGTMEREMEQQLLRASGGEKITRRGRIKWMLRRLFPSRAFMRAYAERHCPRVFRPLPLAYLWRILVSFGRIPRHIKHSMKVK